MEEIGAEQPVSNMTVQDATVYLAVLAVTNPNEPVFILRGRDMLAPAAVFAWARSAERHGVGLKKLAGAWDVAGKMLSWPGRRMPD
jgi:hypothetical protein